MAKKKPATKKAAATTDNESGKRGDKSNAVRAYLGAHPGAKPKEIVSELAKQGIEVSPNLVSIVKSKFKKSKRGRPAGSKNKGRKPGRKPAAASSNGDAIGAALALVQSAGGIAAARATLDRLEQIRSLL